MSEGEHDDDGAQANKRRKTGADSFVAVHNDEDGDEDEDEDDDEEQVVAADDMDGFIAHEEDIEEEAEEERRRLHQAPQISEDTLRMIAEGQGKKYVPDIDIDQGLSSEHAGQPTPSSVDPSTDPHLDMECIVD